MTPVAVKGRPTATFRRGKRSIMVVADGPPMALNATLVEQYLEMAEELREVMLATGAEVSVYCGTSN